MKVSPTFRLFFYLFNPLAGLLALLGWFMRVFSKLPIIHQFIMLIGVSLSAKFIKLLPAVVAGYELSFVKSILSNLWALTFTLLLFAVVRNLFGVVAAGAVAPQSPPQTIPPEASSSAARGKICEAEW